MPGNGRKPGGGGPETPQRAKVFLATPHWLVIVHPDKRDLYTRLRRSFESATLVEVIVDRRLGERRRTAAGLMDERRRVERRRKAILKEPAPTEGYRLIQVADGFQVLQAEARVPAKCPDCGVLLDFEMPHFGELPARLEMNVLHTKSSAFSAQHVVEAQAFRASGRPFLACRMLARRRFAAG